MHRERNKKSSELVHLDFKNDKVTGDTEVINSVRDQFYELEGIDDTWTQEKYDQENMGVKWVDYIQDYNNKILNLDYREIEDRYGDIYLNSYLRRSLRVFRQLLNDMLQPIWIRDVPYNIKGRCSSNFEEKVNRPNIKRVK